MKKAKDAVKRLLKERRATSSPPKELGKAIDFAVQYIKTFSAL